MSDENPPDDHTSGPRDDHTSGPRDDHTSSDLETIREWAVARDVVPVEMAGAGTGPGLDLVPVSEGDAYEVLGWEEFADRFANSELVVQRADDDLEILHGEQVEQGTVGQPHESGGAGDPSVDEDPRTVEPDPGSDEPADPGMDEPAMGSDDPVERERREHGTSPGGSVEHGGSTVDEVDEGKQVVDDAGQQVGIVVATDQEEGLLYVDPNPSFTRKVMAKIGWGNAGEGYPVEAEHVQDITDDKVILKPGSALGEADRD